MKKSNENSTVNYEPEFVTEDVSVKYTVTHIGTEKRISGTIKKCDESAGNVFKFSRDNKLNIVIDPADVLSKDELLALLNAIPEQIEELSE